MGLSDLPAWSVLPIYVAMESAVVLIVNLSGDENGKPRYNTSSLVRRLPWLASFVLLFRASFDWFPVVVPTGDGARAVEAQHLFARPLPGAGRLPRADVVSLDAVAEVRCPRLAVLHQQQPVPPCTPLVLQGCARVRNTSAGLCSGRSRVGVMWCYCAQVLAGNMPAAFQVLLNLRVLWTGFMFMWLLNRVLTPRQWAACGVLVVGALVSQSQVWVAACLPHALWPMADLRCLCLPCRQLLFSGSDTSEMTFVGLTLTFAYTWISVGAGVYNELLLKTGGSRSIHLANVPLYMFGVFFNLLVLLVQGSGDERGFWTGWGLPSTWVLVVLQAFVGLGVSAIVRKYDNVVKILCNTVVNIVVYIFSVMFLGYSVQLDFVLGASLVLTAAYIYNTSPKSEAATPQKRDAESGSSRK